MMEAIGEKFSVRRRGWKKRHRKEVAKRWLKAEIMIYLALHW
jgi:hypothetical protein